jgi:hypothetical protein
MAEKWFALEGTDVDFHQAWFIAAKNPGNYDVDRPIIGAVVYDYHHYNDRPLILAEYDAKRRKFRKLFPRRFEPTSYGNGSRSKPYNLGMSKKLQAEILSYLKSKFKRATWLVWGHR